MGNALKSYLIGQFKNPRGLVGAMAGQIMRRRASNVRRNLWTVELMGLNPTNRVLEIGYGPGFALAHVCKQLTEGMATGLDHSETMFKMARRRNARAITNGKLKLLLGSVEDQSMLHNIALSGPFNVIFAVNVAMFWHKPIDVLQRLRRCLDDGGDILLTFQPRSGAQTDAAAMAAGEHLAEKMRAAGLSDIRIERLKSVTPMIVCVIGSKATA
jgi:SAM-dependent methyltransferase